MPNSLPAPHHCLPFMAHSNRKPPSKPKIGTPSQIEKNLNHSPSCQRYRPNGSKTKNTASTNIIHKIDPTSQSLVVLLTERSFSLARLKAESGRNCFPKVQPAIPA